MDAFTRTAGWTKQTGTVSLEGGTYENWNHTNQARVSANRKVGAGETAIR